MAWIYLILAGLSEIVWAFGLKESHGFTVLSWSLFTLFFLIAGFYLLARSIRRIPIGTAYAVFTGIGAAGTAVAGVVFFDEPAGVMKMISLVVLIGGILGLKLFGNDDKTRKEE